MSTQAPFWAFTAEAIDGAGDTHLTPGIHVRALPSPKLGVPAIPLVVTRAAMGPAQARDLCRTDGVVWIDSQGASRTVPFDVTPDNPVYGYFPVPNVFFSELGAIPGPVPPPVQPGPPVAAAAAVVRDIGEMLQRPVPIRTMPVTRPPFDLDHLRNVLEGAASLAAAPSLRFEALANTGLGVVPFQSRDQAPYALAAWPIPLVRVLGRGTVRGIRWLDATRLRTETETFWELWSLPVKGASQRYTPTANAPSEALDRVKRAAVARQPLYVAYTAVAPAASPPAGPAEAVARVAQVRPEIDRWLDRLLHDLGHPISEVSDTQTVAASGAAAASGVVAVPIEPFLIAGAVDADVGHYLGFGDRDEAPLPAAGSLVLYRIRGLWRWEPTRWSSGERPAFAPAVRKDLQDAVTQFAELEKYQVVPHAKGPFVDLYAMAVALVGSPSSAPGAISFDGVEDRGWLATPAPPDVRRAVRLTASGFRPHPVAAIAATDSAGDRPLNPYPHLGRVTAGTAPPGGTPLPVIVSRPGDATGPAQGRFEDRDAPDSAVLYRLAQGDWFGRWSPWRTRTAPAPARRPPMRPTIELYPQPPAIGTPPPAGPLSATIEVRIPIPRAADLPAGGATLARLDLDETFAGASTTTTGYVLGALAGATIETHPAPAHDLLVIPRTGPALLTSESRKVTYVARWSDASSPSLASADSDPAIRTMVDPRPPPSPPVVTELRYTARPDARGHARVDLDFATTPGARYRVYASTETILLKALDSAGRTAEANDIRSSAPGAPRAMRFRAHQSLFGWDDFECLTKQSIVATGTTKRFTHRVSGSLDVLAIYRVIGEGASGALSDLTQADLVPFAVPNLGAPPRPQIAVLNAGLDPTTQGARLRVKTPVGRARPKAWRLRRASVPTSDPLRMQIVDQGPVGALAVEPDSVGFVIDATAPLRPWRQYRFAVEVQAGDPPGAPTVGTIFPGEWSEASAPATLAVIPPAGPAPPSAVAITNAGGVLQITVHHPAPDSLASTPFGPHRFEVWLVEPGARQSRAVLFTRGDGDTWVGSDPTGAPAGAHVSIRVVDPIGRRSDAATSNLL